MTPLLTWIDVAAILRLDKANDAKGERERKRKVMRIMREAGAIDLGRSDWRVNEDGVKKWLKRNGMVFTNEASTGGAQTTR
jgi:hypothetical protein